LASSLLLHVEPEVSHVSVLHNVVFFFQAELAGAFQGGLTSQFEEIIAGIDGGLNKAFFKICLGDAGPLGASPILSLITVLCYMFLTETHGSHP